MKGVKHCVNDIIKSAEDKLLYRCLKLQNDMQFLLISDGSTDKSAALLDMKVVKL
jgi:secreted Zn-dependent insulinase-like peptidase